MDLIYLRSFIEVARCHSFTKAAENLGYAQSSVTTHIQKLENEYGVILFERFGRTMRLTSAGEELRCTFEQILALFDESKHLLSRQVRGQLYIGSIESLTGFFLPPIYHRFRETYPQITLQTLSLHEPLILQQVKEGAMDMGLILDRLLAEEDVETIPIRREELVLVAEPNHPLCRLDAVRMDDLRELRYVATEMTCTYRQTFERLLAAHGIGYQIDHEFGSLEAIKQFVGYGLGVGLLPRIALDRELAGGRLKALPFSHPDLEFYIQIVLHKRKWRNPAIRHLIQLLTEAAETDKRLAR